MAREDGSDGIVIRQRPDDVLSGLGATSDGRTLRRQRTHATIVDACRRLMLDGVLRPDSRSLADRSRISHRTLFWHFPRLQDVYREALEDAAVAGAVERRIPRDRAGILRAVVLGEVAHIGDSGENRPQPDLDV